MMRDPFFTFVPFGARAPREATCCDGLVEGAGLQLSHWEGNLTPAELKADTSVEIALRYAAGTTGDAAAPTGATAAPRPQVVVNNHFDVDGVLAVFVLLEPEVARAHASLIVAAAEAGDFDEWPADPRGLRLEMAVRRLAGGQSDEAAYARVLPQLPALLSTLDQREDLWGDEWRELQEAEDRAAAGGLSARREGDIALLTHARGVSELPGPVLHRRAGAARRWLLVFEEECGRFRYRYERPRHAWADTVVRPLLPRPRRRDLHRALGDGWSLKGELGMTGLAATEGAVSTPPDQVLAICQRHDPR
jgi:hypothetical protein